jgi:iron complex transport system substrate-binding protein
MPFLTGVNESQTMICFGRALKIWQSFIPVEPNSHQSPHMSSSHLSQKSSPWSLLRALLIGLFMAAFIGPAWSAHGATFHDALGREVRLEDPPQRVIGLAPSITEILYYLGLGDKVVGATQFSSFPPEAARKPRVGSYVNLNVESIIDLSPDLIIATKDGNERRDVELLEQAGIPVFVVNPRNVQGVIQTIKDVGTVCGAVERAKAQSHRLASRVDRIVQKTRSLPKPLVFVQIQVKPIMTVNRDTFHHDLIRLSGGRNMTGNEPITYPRISLEEVIRRKPEVILISSMERGGRFEKARREWFEWASIPAVQTGRVHLIDSDLIDRPSPRLIEGLEAMARFIHPEVVEEGARRKAQGAGQE